MIASSFAYPTAEIGCQAASEIKYRRFMTTNVLSLSHIRKISQEIASIPSCFGRVMNLWNPSWLSFQIQLNIYQGIDKESDATDDDHAEHSHFDHLVVPSGRVIVQLPDARSLRLAS
jgi:hypothetical protein